MQSEAVLEQKQAKNDEILQKVKKQSTLWKRVKRSKTSYFMLAPYFILFFFFTVMPVVMSIGLSFTYFNMLEAPTFVGWKNYTKLLLEDDIFLKKYLPVCCHYRSGQLLFVSFICLDYQ